MKRGLVMLSDQFVGDTQKRWASDSGACGSGAHEMQLISGFTVETAIQAKWGSRHGGVEL